MKDQSKMKVLIVGAGRIAGFNEFDKYRKKPCSHYGTFSKSKNFTVCGVYDTNINKSKLFSKKFGIPFFKTLNDALNTVKPKLICIAVPYNRNLDVVKKICNSKSKCKIIFCEKPISNNLSSAKKIVELCQNNRIQLFVNNRRLDTPYENLFNLLKKYQSKIIQINASCSSGIHAIGSHMLDLLLHICGEPIKVFSCRERNKVKMLKYSKNFTQNDPRVFSLIKFKKNIYCFFSCSANLNYSYFEIEIILKNGKIRVSDNGSILEYWLPVKPKKSTLSFKLKKYSLKVNTSKTLFAKIPNFIFNNQKNFKNNLLSGINGLKTYKIIDALVSSSK